ncbi:CLUMA_CG004280, isoform A [Clunio marinus]|uniref:CLUMA_CG004280, isoform A n=1 Tax=Clunio marinus TaxID=568069 RepID=A0A1J1HSQ7_9DIPT|nr:CLUMA_CG004280, isoform A [Clunio marinus]
MTSKPKFGRYPIKIFSFHEKQEEKKKEKTLQCFDESSHRAINLSHIKIYDDILQSYFIYYLTDTEFLRFFVINLSNITLRLQIFCHKTVETQTLLPFQLLNKNAYQQSLMMNEKTKYPKEKIFLAQIIIQLDDLKTTTFDDEVFPTALR